MQAGDRQDLATEPFRDVLAWHADRGRWPRRHQEGREDDLAQRWRRWAKSTRLAPAAGNLKERIDALTQTERDSREGGGLAESAEQALQSLLPLTG